jgi:hypothetical protein
MASVRPQGLETGGPIAPASAAQPPERAKRPAPIATRAISFVIYNWSPQIFECSQALQGAYGVYAFCNFHMIDGGGLGSVGTGTMYYYPANGQWVPYAMCYFGRCDPPLS